MILYKYRGNSAFTENIFKNKNVWLSNAEGLNDPFECSIQAMAKDWIEERIKEGIDAQIMGFYQSVLIAKREKFKDLFFGLTEKQTIEFLGKLNKKGSVEEVYNTIREFIRRKTGGELSDPRAIFSNFDKQLNQVGIFSLSETAENQLMWAHYGEESKGIAIGFEVEANSKLASSKYCLQVNYSDVLPAFTAKEFLCEFNMKFDSYARQTTISKISMEDPTFKLAISTKPTCWSYEKEWRYVEEKSGAYPLPSKIKEVIFGLRCTNETKEKYKSLLKNNIQNDISYHEIKNVPNSNKIIKISID